MAARVRNWVSFHPMTAWAQVVAFCAVAYVVTVGVTPESVTRSAAGSTLLLFAGMTVQTWVYYGVANKRTRDPDRGALPHHVRQISASYLLLAMYAVADIWGRAGLMLTWRVPLALLAALLGFRALIAILNFERRRVHVISPHITDLRGSPHTDRRQ